jgi:hypothetical protein
MARLPSDPIPLKFHPVRVSLPARAAYDIEAFNKVVVSLAGRLGCDHCLSGAACFFELERDFVVDPATFDVHGLEVGGF